MAPSATAELGFARCPLCIVVTSGNHTEKRGLFDFEVDFSNRGGIQGQGFRLDIAGDDITDQELADCIVRDLRLLMVGAVRIHKKEIIVERHKRSQFVETPFSRLLTLTAEGAISYREGLKERRVAPLPESIARLVELGGPLLEQPTDAETVVAQLDEIGFPATVATAGGRYFWVRQRQLASGHARSQLAGRSVGSECLSERDVSGGHRSRRDRSALVA